MRSRLAAAGVVAVLAAAGCGSTVAPPAQALAPPSVSPVSERGAVPWVDLPGRPFEPSSRHPAPPLTAITLAPHTGTARTTLYWYLPWCGPAPNPVSVTITSPADDAVLTVAPAGGLEPTTLPGQPRPTEQPGPRQPRPVPSGITGRDIRGSAGHRPAHTEPLASDHPPAPGRARKAPAANQMRLYPGLSSFSPGHIVRLESVQAQ